MISFSCLLQKGIYDRKAYEIGGLDIDRLVMLITQATSIPIVLFFPIMRAQGKELSHPET
jgi:hypothetical protein